MTNSAYDYVYRMHRPLGSYWPVHRHIYQPTTQRLRADRIGPAQQDEPPPQSSLTLSLFNDTWGRITGPATINYTYLYPTTYQPTKQIYNPFNPLHFMQLDAL